MIHAIGLRRLPADRPEPCRYCHRPTWTADDTGPLHACCAGTVGTQGLPDCPLCRAAERPDRGDNHYSIKARRAEKGRR